MAERSSFVLYTKYEEQLNLLTDEQAGQLMRAIFAYQREGEVDIQDKLVLMVWTMMKQQLDFDGQKYAATCQKRKDAGAKGGKTKKSQVKKSQGKKATDDAHDTNGSKANAFSAKQEEANQANAFFAKQREAKQADNENEYEYEYEYDYEYENENEYENEHENGIEVAASSDDDHHYDNLNSNERAICGGDGGESGSSKQIFRFGREDIYPTVQEEFVQFEALAERLCKAYLGRSANAIDIEKVMEHTHRRVELSEEDAIAVYDGAKGELLEYAFGQAVEANRANWKYIDGIYRNFTFRDIETVRDAWDYEFDRPQRQANGYLG